MKKPLIPKTKVSSEGALYYNESFQAWNTLKLKKELFSEFPQLKEKRSKFGYKLVFHRTKKEFEKAVKDLIDKKEEIMPMLLFIYKEG